MNWFFNRSITFYQGLQKGTFLAKKGSQNLDTPIYKYPEVPSLANIQIYLYFQNCVSKILKLSSSKSLKHKEMDC